MLQFYAEMMKRLSTDEDGVVSFEYIIVACCIIAVVAAVFNGTGANSISGALSSGIGKIVTAFNTALP